MGGITFGRTVEGFELPRPNYEDFVKEEEGQKLAKAKGPGQ